MEGISHRRSSGVGAVSFQLEDGPTSTTKAMMVSIVVPRLVATSKADEDDDDAGDDKDAKTVATIVSAVAEEEPHPLKSTIVEEADRKKATERKDSEGSKEPKLEDKPSLVKMLTSSINAGDEKEEEEEEEPTPEEAAHVVVSNDDPDETEVNIEALLRLTLKTLLVEWHLLTVPTFTTTNQQLAQQLDPTSPNRPRDAWVQVQFMARPTSLAVVLDRLERIGIGTNCGSVTVYRAELCRTTSAYAKAPIEEQETPPLATNEKTMPSIRASSSGKDGKLTPTVEETEKSEAKMTERMIEAAKMEWKNAATRLRIEQVREQISEQAALTFDFIALLTIASILAGVGLITDNTVVIVASMLVSPIMGPVLGTCHTWVDRWPFWFRHFLEKGRLFS